MVALRFCGSQPLGEALFYLVALGFCGSDPLLERTASAFQRNDCPVGPLEFGQFLWRTFIVDVVAQQVCDRVHADILPMKGYVMDLADERQQERLVKAAPALLDALKTARRVLVVACGTTAPYIREALEVIDAAISKCVPPSLGG